MAKKTTQRSFGQKVRADMDRMKQDLIERERSFENYVKEHPMQSVGIAAGVGMLVGASAMLMRK